MTNSQRLASILIGGVSLALALLGLNMAFEAAGSIPDIEGCGFLAGSIPALLFLFPVLSGLVTNVMNRQLQRKYSYIPRSLRLGFHTALVGSVIYLVTGFILAALRPGGTIRFEAVAVGVLLALLCGVGGYCGALRNEIVTARLAWRHGKG